MNGRYLMKMLTKMKWFEKDKQDLMRFNEFYKMR